MARRSNWEDQIGRRLRLRDLHVLFIVAQRGSMAKAAAELGISQPAVSDVIATLEGEIGVKLFDRKSHGVEPTIYGQALLKRSLNAFDELKQGIRERHRFPGRSNQRRAAHRVRDIIVPDDYAADYSSVLASLSARESQRRRDTATSV